MTQLARRSSLLLATCLALPAFAAACIEPSPTPAIDPPEGGPSFAGVSQQVRRRAISAAAGHDAMLALEVTAQLPRYPEGGCPFVSSSPAGTVYEGGCDLVDGGRIEGRAVVDLGDATRPTLVRFDRFQIETADTFLSFDGTVVRTPDDLIRVDLGAVLGGIFAHSELALDCSDGVLCEPSSGSTVDVERLGEIAVSGQWAEGRAPRGYLALDAADQLVVPFDGTCPTYLLDGAPAGKYCIPSPPSLSIENELIATASCLDGRMIVLGSSRYDYQRVQFKRVTGIVSGTVGPVETFSGLRPLEPTVSASPDGHAWEADLGACAEVELRGGVLEAVVDGQRVARTPIGG